MLRALLGSLLISSLVPGCSSGDDDNAGQTGRGGEQAASAGTGATSASGAGNAASGGSSATGGSITSGAGGDTPGGTSGKSSGAGGSSGTAAAGASGRASGAGRGSGTGGATGGAGKAQGGSDQGGTGHGGASGASGAGASSGGMSGSAGGSAMPGVKIVGRTETGTDGLRFSWPGVSFEARFSGTQASIQLSDAANANEFEVVVDGVVADTPLVTASGQTTYPIANGLADGTHDVLVWRRTEAYYNPTEFLGFTGFSAGGALLAPPDPLPHRIEVIGDSITVGYGNEGTLPCTADTTNENNYLAYASVAARELHADLVTIAWSGIGMYRNYGETGPSTDTMPTRYDRAVPTEDDSSWDFSKFTPEAVVINLGTNDYSTQGDPGQPFVDAYASFVEHLRTKYPNAYIFCLIQASGSDVNIDKVVSMQQSSGDRAIESFDINVTDGGNGCDYHPDVAKDKAMGDKLAGELENVLGW